jgi:hypothetical protein
LGGLAENLGFWLKIQFSGDSKVWHAACNRKIRSEQPVKNFEVLKTQGEIKTMAIQKKSLITNLSATKKAVVASHSASPATSAPATLSPASRNFKAAGAKNFKAVGAKNFKAAGAKNFKAAGAKNFKAAGAKNFKAAGAKNFKAIS